MLPAVATRFHSMRVVFAGLSLLAVIALVVSDVVSGPRLAGAQSAGDVIYVNTDALNLRSDASISADVISVLETGVAVTVVEGPVTADGYDWYEVTADAGDGWVDGEYLSDSLTYVAGEYATGDALVVNTDVLNLRSDASIGADVLAQLVTGDAATIVDGPVSADGYSWYKVDTDYGTGWVDGEYLSTAMTVSIASPGFAIGDALVVDTDSLNLRNDATTSAEAITTLVAGDSVTILDGPVSADGYTWYLVDAGAVSGWVAGEYLGTTVTVSNSFGFSYGDWIAVDTDALNLRSDATTSADVLAVLATGEAGMIVDGPVSADGYTWYQIQTDYGTGWVDGEYLAFG